MICFLDDDGYLANLECVYYDDAVAEWPNVEECAVLMRDAEGYLLSAVLPNGAHVRLREENDRWVSFEPADGGFNASTWSGWRESFDAAGQTVSRVFTK